LPPDSQTPPIPHAMIGLLHNLPLIVPHGPLRGMLWTLFPFTSYWRGTHEVHILRALQKIGPAPASAAWDVGAHFGYYAFWFARLVGPRGQVAAFEPNPASYDKLLRHHRLNRLPQLHIFPCACGEDDATGNLIGEGTGAHFAYLGEPLPPSTQPVAVRRLDSLAGEHGLRDPQWIKMDVEGSAGPALQGALHTLRRSRPSLLIATHSPQEISHIHSLLRPLEYIPHDLSPTPLPWESLRVGQDYLFLQESFGR
jgi:FkbM family methyltransferase